MVSNILVALIVILCWALITSYYVILSLSKRIRDIQNIVNRDDITDSDKIFSIQCNLRG